MELSARSLKPGDMCMSILGNVAELVLGVKMILLDGRYVYEVTFLHLFGFAGRKCIFCETLEAGNMFFNVVRVDHKQ